MSDGQCYTHGGLVGNRSEVTLGAGEFVTSIEGYSCNACIISLKFVTNRSIPVISVN